MCKKYRETVKKNRKKIVLFLARESYRKKYMKQTVIK